ncbi:MAG: tetratricopeptide repeat protein [Polyangiaceae bacterium]
MADSQQPPSIRSLAGRTDSLLGDDGSSPSSEAPSASFDGEDFLYHLYRGSELLQDNLVGEAKEELERALSLQPRDIEGQGLLAVVYFRLGLYPRAIEIFQELTKKVPSEVTPWLNLGLCYLKTGQNARAREALEDVTRRVPGHRRAWGYLGLAYERMGDAERAVDAFQRAGHSSMVRRLERAHGEEGSATPLGEPGREALRQAAADAIAELEGDMRPFSRVPAAATEDDALRTSRWLALEPGRAQLPSAPKEARSPRPLSAAPPAPTPTELSKQVDATHTRTAASALDLVALRVESAAGVRADLVRALRPDSGVFTRGELLRRSLGRESREALGGPRHPLVRLSGQGNVVLAPPKGFGLHLTALNDEFFYVREERLVGFDDALGYECGRLPLGPGEHAPMVQLSGTGALIFAATTRLTTLTVSHDASAWTRSEDVVGWTGRLMPHPVPQESVPVATGRWLRFSGEGTLWLDAG